MMVDFVLTSAPLPSPTKGSILDVRIPLSVGDFAIVVVDIGSGPEEHRLEGEQYARSLLALAQPIAGEPAIAADRLAETVPATVRFRLAHFMATEILGNAAAVPSTS